MHTVKLDTPAGVVTLESGRIARQADGAVVVRRGDAVILAAAVAAQRPNAGSDFFPLTVEYRERLAAAGRIPGSYQRREGRITDREVLASRLADRSIRPLFPAGFRAETQVLITVLSADDECAPDALAMLGSAAALHVSGIPWSGPVAGVRIAHAHGEWRVLPSRAFAAAADLDLVVAAGPQGLVMVEGAACEASEALILEALDRASAVCRLLCAGLDELRSACGRPKRVVAAPLADAGLTQRVEELTAGRIDAALERPTKAERRLALAQAREAAAPAVDCPEQEAAVAALVEEAIRRRLRAKALRGERVDGRGPEDIRPIDAEVGWLPRCHGSAIFTRGETQALVSCTLGRASDQQEIETLAGPQQERLLLHYNFPPFSVGEVRALRGPGRREIGHGALAHRALAPVLPAPDQFPYTIRLVSDIAESNGSSSMATVCGGCLALMDAGVPIRRPVAGIAMGLVAEGGRTVVLSDILGDEDHLGDMDFKVAGTTEGVTAIQLDNKVGSVSAELLAGALDQARRGRLSLLERMAETLAGPRPALSRHAPRAFSLRLRPERIRELIGPGGRTIQEIQAATSASIDVDQDGLVRVYGADAAGAAEALRRVRWSTLEPEVGRVYDGEVTLVSEFFAIVRLGASTEGKLHISELDQRRVARVQDLLRVGDAVRVRVLGVDGQGRIVLSRRAALGADEAEVAG